MCIFGGTVQPIVPGGRTLQVLPPAPQREKGALERAAVCPVRAATLGFM